MNKPIYNDLGMASTMGEKLKEYVELALLKDLENYNCFAKECNFDWSESCVEGCDFEYLGGIIDRFSGIKVFDKNHELLAEGWMDYKYVKDTNRLIVYWAYLSVLKNGKMTEIKTRKEVSC